MVEAVSGALLAAPNALKNLPRKPFSILRLWTQWVMLLSSLESTGQI
jgi:hypothetical protein